jgi:hypothetical protein
VKLYSYLVLRGEFTHTDRSGNTKTYKKGRAFSSHIDLMLHFPKLYLHSFDVIGERGVPYQSGIERIVADGINIESRVTVRPRATLAS